MHVIVDDIDMQGIFDGIVTCNSLLKAFVVWAAEIRHIQVWTPHAGQVAAVPRITLTTGAISRANISRLAVLGSVCIVIKQPGVAAGKIYILRQFLQR